MVQPMMCKVGVVTFELAFCVISRTVFASDDSNVLGGTGLDGGFTTLSPDPDILIWDPPSVSYPEFRAGWLNAPVLHDTYITPFEKPPRACLRILMKPAAVQPAKLGPILLHCGGPGSHASCAHIWGKWLEMHSSYLVGPPLSESYDYWSISQRGMLQDHVLDSLGFHAKCPFKDEALNAIPSWPSVECNGIDDLLNKTSIEEVLKRLDGSPDMGDWSMLQEIRKGPNAQTFGVPFFNETYARWLYRLSALEYNLCFHSQRYQMRSPTTNRSYNILEYSGTSNLANDIELFRSAIGAKRMSIYGVSYGTKVGSVYATIFPDKVHRLILDGDMGSDPDILKFAGWVGESTEEVWVGLAEACDNSVMGGGVPATLCPAGPGVTRKLHKLLKSAVTEQEKNNAVVLFGQISQVVYAPGVPCANHLMRCIADLYAFGNANNADCSFVSHSMSGTCDIVPPIPFRSYPGTKGGLDVIAAVLGMDHAGRLTEESFIEWWRNEKDAQPLGITRSLAMAAAVGTWPAIPRPNPPAGSPVVAPLIIGNLYDGQTPYRMAQQMLQAFPSGRLLTSQFYGHGLQGPRNIKEVVKRYEDEMLRGVPPTYDDEAAKLLCVKVALQYLKDGLLPTNYVCKTASPVMTGPGTVENGHPPVVQILV